MTKKQWISSNNSFDDNSRTQNNVPETKRRIGDIKSKTYSDKKKLLTSKQEKIIKIAFEKGYYDYPKGITLRELSKILNISFSILNEILRRGQKKIIKEYYLSKQR
jgi:predicted DNA binding protein